MEEGKARRVERVQERSSRNERESKKMKESRAKIHFFQFSSSSSSSLFFFFFFFPFQKNLRAMFYSAELLSKRSPLGAVWCVLNGVAEAERE